MKRLATMILAITMMMVFAVTVSAQGAYYVQSMKAKVMSGPSFKSGVMGEVAKGHTFTATGREGSWVKVTYNAKTGYVSSLLVATHPPLDKEGVIRAEQDDIKQGVRRRASTYTSAAAARGLAADDRKRLSMEEEVNYKALEQIEAFTVSNDEVIKFAEGR